MATQSSVSASVAGSDSSPPSTASQCSITSAPVAPSSPRAARPNSSAYLRAAPKSSHWSSRAVAVDPSVSASGAGQRQVGRHLVQRAHGVRQREVPGRAGVVLDHGQHDGGGADLQEGGDLRQVGVADDHVQAPEALGVGVGLVPCVDDRALQRRLEPDDLLEELGPLRNLVLDGLGVQRRRLGADLARPGEERCATRSAGRPRRSPWRRGRPGPSCSSRGSRRSCPSRRSCSCRRWGRGARACATRRPPWPGAAPPRRPCRRRGTRAASGTRGSSTPDGRGPRRSGRRW